MNASLTQQVSGQSAAGFDSPWGRFLSKPAQRSKNVAGKEIIGANTRPGHRPGGMSNQFGKRGPQRRDRPTWSAVKDAATAALVRRGVSVNQQPDAWRDVTGGLSR